MFQGDQGGFQESSHESGGYTLGRAMFHESSPENHMLGQGWGWFQDFSLENQAWLAGLRTPVLKTMRLAVGNGWFHESSLESIEIT